MKKTLAVFALFLCQFAFAKDSVQTHDLRPWEETINNVWSANGVCAGPVYDFREGVFKRFRPCWPSDHDDGGAPYWTKVRGVKISKQGKQTCFETTGKTITFRSNYSPTTQRENPQNKSGEGAFSVKVPKPVKTCY